MFTGVCLWLGQQVQRAHDQERAVKAIYQAGGRVWYDYQSDGRGHFRRSNGPPGPDWLPKFIGEHVLARVVDVEFRDENFGDSDLVRLARHLERLPKLRSLGLSGTCVTDKGMPSISEVDSIEILHLSRLVKGDGLAFLARLPKLDTVSVSNGELSDVGMQHVGRIGGLKRLTVDNCRITDAGLAYLRSLQKLERLDISSRNITDAGLEHLRSLRRLERLDISSRWITDAGLKHFRQLGSLKSLSLTSRSLNLTAGRGDYAGVGLRRQRPFDILQVVKLNGAVPADQWRVSYVNPQGLTTSQVTLSRSQLNTAGLDFLEPLSQFQFVEVYDYHIYEDGRLDRTMHLRKHVKSNWR